MNHQDSQALAAILTEMFPEIDGSEMMKAIGCTKAIDRDSPLAIAQKALDYAQTHHPDQDYAIRLQDLIRGS